MIEEAKKNTLITAGLALLRFGAIFLLCYLTLNTLALSMQFRFAVVDDGSTQSKVWDSIDKRFETDRVFLLHSMSETIAKTEEIQKNNPPIEATEEAQADGQKEASLTEQDIALLVQDVIDSTTYAPVKSIEKEKLRRKLYNEFDYTSFPLSIAKMESISTEEKRDEFLYQYTMKAFSQGIQLLGLSLLLMLLLLSGIRTYRMTKVYPVYTFRWLQIPSLVVIGITLVYAALPEVFLSVYRMPGERLLEVVVGKYQAFQYPTLIYLLQVAFVMCFAGILSRLLQDTFLRDTPDEHLLQFRGEPSFWWVFRLHCVRMSNTLQPAMPFLVMATLFCNARATEEGMNSGLYHLFQMVFDMTDAAYLSYSALFLSVIVIFLLNFLGKSFLQMVDGVLMTIPSDSGAR